jgi:hypothetical protein
MARLSIDLQDGFTDDTVVLHVGGKERFHKQHVSTKPVIGWAESFQTEVSSGRVNLRVTVPTQGIVKTIPLEVSSDTHLGLSIVNGELEHIVSDQPFTYA